VWYLGPLPIRAYALCIIAGIVVALWLTNRRWSAVGGHSDDVWDIAGWAIVFGIVGGRIYHVVTDPELYFGDDKNPIDAFKIWDGGLGIWGAVALGGVGAWIGCRRKGINLSRFADAVAPGIVVAQGIGRWGNWFNNELYGGPTSVPWKLQIHQIDLTTGKAALGSDGKALILGYFQPTFLYESLWDIALCGLLLYVSRGSASSWVRGRANIFALYVIGYTVGRGWIEALRQDHANHILGLRLNIWVTLLVFSGAVAWFVRHRAVPLEPPYSVTSGSNGLDSEASDSDVSDPDMSDSDTSESDTSESEDIGEPLLSTNGVEPGPGVKGDRI
jgi:prolipoprotein diacylglyceryl transferase